MVSKLWLRSLSVLPLLFRSSSANYNTTTIARDVCIIGGGASGTYAAIRLQQLGHSVAVVEKQSRLGGHVNTYYDPVSGEFFDFGVLIYENTTVVSQFFASLNVSTALPSIGSSTGIYADYKSGKAVEIPASLAWSNETEVGAALVEYASLLEQYPYLSNGFDLPSPIPEDLLLPWGEFVDKYNLAALSYTVYLYAEGIGNILDQTTLYVMKYVSLELVHVLLGEADAPTFVASASNGNQELYDQALKQLGSDALLSSVSTAIRRQDDGVSVDVYSNATGQSTTIRAKQLLIAVQPTLSNIQSLGLDITVDETSLLKQFHNSYYWNAVVKADGTPSDIGGYYFVDLDAPYAIPALPGLYSFSAVAGTSDLFTAYFASPFYLPDDEVKLAMLSDVTKTLTANGYNLTGASEILAFDNHSPFSLTVSADSIRDGFYGKVNALQGTKSTWWTGAAWQAQDSSQIWNWTEYSLLPKILASL